jgi:polysaccharide biosynthesis transport protein
MPKSLPEPNVPALLPMQQQWMMAPGSPQFYSPSFSQEPEQSEQGLPLSHYLWIVRRQLFKIIAFVAVCTLATFVVSNRLTPIYESVATIDVDRQAQSSIVGQDNSRAGGNPYDADQFLATQIKIIQSDSVLRPVAARYNLLEQEGQFKDLPEERRIIVGNSPIVLKNLKVTRPPNTYLLLVSYRSSDPQIAANVANDIANSYLQHSYTLRIKSSASLSSFVERQIEDLKAKMERSSQRQNQFERELNVINPEEKTSILSSRLLQLNTEYTNAQADRVRKEAQYNSMKSGTLEAAQISSQGDALVKLSEHVNEARQKLAVIKATYGANHPEFRKASSDLTEMQRQFEDLRRNIAGRIEADFQQSRNREQMLKHSVEETKNEFDRLNSRSFQYQQLKREADGDKKLYDELNRKIQEAGINAGFQNNSTIRIADEARPAAKPVFPSLRLNMLLALLFATLLGVGTAVLTDMLDNTVRDPEQITRTLKTDVVGTLPAVKDIKGLIGTAHVTTAQGLVKYGEKEAGRDGYKAISSYEESIRTLRNSILLGDFDRRLRSLLVTSATPGEGKTTTAVHLAVAHSDQKKRTLIIDCDLRRPSVHQKLNIHPSNGLSNVLTDEIGWRDAIMKLDQHPDLDIIAAGPPSRRASDLVGTRMVELLEEASKEYDLIIVDSPPLLGFAEPLQIATATDGVIVVTRAGQTSRKAVATVINTLTRLRANVVGVVLNQVKQGMSDSYYYYGYYRKYYRAEDAA